MNPSYRTNKPTYLSWGPHLVWSHDQFANKGAELEEKVVLRQLEPVGISFPSFPEPVPWSWPNLAWSYITYPMISSFPVGLYPYSMLITLLRVIPTMAFNSSNLTIYLAYLSGIPSGMSSDILSGISSDILPGISSDILSGISSDILSVISSHILSVISSDILYGISSVILSGILSDILSGVSSDILSGILSGVSSDILSGISSDILSGKAFGILFGIAFGILSGIPSAILICHTFWHRSWGPGANTGRGWSWLRSGSEHWAWMVVVEVRQRTLGVDGRGWGPAANTGRGWSWLRSGSEHWALMVVVEVRQRTLGVAGRGWGPAANTGRGWSWLRSGDEEKEEKEKEEKEKEEKRRRGRGGAATDIKSNNPHLAGGEKKNKLVGNLKGGETPPTCFLVFKNPWML